MSLLARHRRWWSRGLWWLLVTVCLFVLYLLWPLIALFGVGGLLSQAVDQHVIMLVNEYEARPCGGFVTAVAEVSLLPPTFSVRNSFTFADPLGPPHPLLAPLNPQQTLWDSTLRPAPAHCVSDLAAAYSQQSAAQFADDSYTLWVVPFAFMEGLVHTLDGVSLDGQLITHDTLFATLSRLVSNVDRHDEVALAYRKQPLRTLGVALARRAVWRLDRWPALVQHLAQSLRDQHLFHARLLPPVAESGWGLVEWNIGGAKSSRYLDKTLDVFIREVTPQRWVADLTLTVRHTGHIDEPLSQDWQGLFELTLPAPFADTPTRIQAQLAPGQTFTESKTFRYDGPFAPSFVAHTPQLGQQLHGQVRVSAQAQQRFSLPAGTPATSLTLRESTLTRPFTAQGSSPQPVLLPDELGPYVTFHEFTPRGTVPESIRSRFLQSNRVVEVHFNEPITVSPAFDAQLLDRDYALPTTSDGFLTQYFILPDQRSLLLGFAVSRLQPDERYFLKLTGITDQWGNSLQPGRRTVIDRID